MWNVYWNFLKVGFCSVSVRPMEITARQFKNLIKQPKNNSRKVLEMNTERVSKAGPSNAQKQAKQFIQLPSHLPKKNTKIDT